MNNNDYYRIILVIGNGFDLDLGLETKYSDFAKSDEWKRLYDENVAKSTHYSLLKFLNDKKDVDKWFDIEQALLEYASIKTKGIWFHDVETDKREYELVCNTLEKYLENHLKAFKDDIDEKCCIQLLREIYHSDDVDKKLYTFNYTPIINFARETDILHLSDDSIQHVHGNAKSHTLIMGIDVHSLDEIIPEYSFLIKSNNNSYQAVDIELDMINAKEVIIFGHSLNKIDAVYFDDYFKDLSVNRDDNRRLTIITYNEDSKQQILDNIRKIGISVPKLFSHGHMEFILTNNIGKVGNDSILFKKLLRRYKQLI